MQDALLPHDIAAEEAYLSLQKKGYAWANVNENNLTMHLWNRNQQPKEIFGWPFVKTACGADSAIAPVGGHEYRMVLITKSDRDNCKSNNVCCRCSRIADNLGLK